MSFIFAIVNLLVMTGIAWRIRRHTVAPSKQLFWPSLLFKLMAGACLGLIYRYYYHGVGDTILYFNDSSVLSSFARKNPVDYFIYLWSSEPVLSLTSDVSSQPRTLFMLKLASLFNLLSYDNYWITSAYFSFISFVTAWYLVGQIARAVPAAYGPAVVGFLFLPTAVFWSAGLIKESLAMAGLFFLAGGFIRSWFNQPLRLWEMVLIPLAAWVVWSLKYYFLGVFVPVAIASLVVHRMTASRLRIDSFALKLLVWMIFILVPLVIVTWLHPNFQPGLLMQVIVENYQTFHNVSAPEDLVYYNGLVPTWASLAGHAPKALFAGLFRPMLWEASTGLQMLVALENTGLACLFIAALFRIPQAIRSPHRLLIATVLLYAVVLATFLALSTPNFGTLSRYRVGFLSALVTVLATSNPLFDNVLRLIQRYLGPLAR